MKNYSYRVFYLVSAVLVLLLIIRLINPIVLNGYRLKEMDILADIRMPKPKPAPKPRPVVRKVADQLSDTIWADSCRPGITCLEDYTEKNKAMLHFLAAVDSSKEANIRVAFFGDSFVEGDILTQDLREQLQTAFGGCGVGHLPITYKIAGSRQSSTVKDRGIATFGLAGKCERKELGIAGNYYLTSKLSSFFYRLSKLRKHIDTVSKVRFFYTGLTDSAVVLAYKNGRQVDSARLKPSRGLSFYQLAGKIGSAGFVLKQAQGMKLFGAYLDGNTGLSVDNYSIRGNAGYAIMSMPDSVLKQFNDVLAYRLIILQYGLNVAADSTTNFSAYAKNMDKVIEKAKRCFPHASILLLGVGDRSTRQNGEYVTMTCIPYLIAAQRELASKHGIAFWDMQQAMGGENSMAGYVSKGWARKDYTHISFEGGKELGRELFEALMYEKFKYKKRRLCR